MDLLEATNIEVKFSKIILVLKGLSLKVPNETIVGLLGSNGAGKTTTMKSISGLIEYEDGEVTKGDILFEGKSLLHPHTKGPRRVRLGIVPVFEGRRIFDELTVEENLVVGSYTRSNKKEIAHNISRAFEYFPALAPRSKQIAGYLSGGEQQMLALGRALAANPKLILLDEPSLGLSPILSKQVFSIIKRINEEQRITILLVEQNANLAFSVSDYVYVMENGRIVTEGTVDELRADRNIQEFYVGETESGKRRSFKEIKHYKRQKRWFSA
ncbi:MAG: ABC transporter ATP-binding protein [Deltaproteobacteria bacterium]|nr:ABC transporter ATP-binding protein [Deltaproteobacteria bacterium]MBW2342934.1 ABC transporter ATP-binding protein [Deltaproteobacteria bacterium]